MVVIKDFSEPVTFDFRTGFLSSNAGIFDSFSRGSAEDVEKNKIIYRLHAALAVQAVALSNAQIVLETKPK